MENFGLGVWVTVTCRNMVVARSTAVLGKPHVPCSPCVCTCLGGAVCSFCLWSVCVFTCHFCLCLPICFLPSHPRHQPYFPYALYISLNTQEIGRRKTNTDFKGLSLLLGNTDSVSLSCLFGVLGKHLRFVWSWARVQG